MKFYYIQVADHPKTSWVLNEVVKGLMKHPRPPGMPPVFYKFFPASDVEVRMKPEYQALCCYKCGRYETDKMFEVGFNDPVTIRFKGDYGYTTDRVFAVNGKFLKVLRKANVEGYDVKPLGKSGWYALKVTLLVDHDNKAVDSVGPSCSECGRPKESGGAFDYLSQLSLPSQANTLFSTKTSWPSWHASDRPIFITEQVLLALLEGGVAGGYCVRLWTAEEAEKQREIEKQGVRFWKPPGTLVHLNGKGGKK